MTEISFLSIKSALIKVTEELDKNRQYFNDLDAPIGDSDHVDTVWSAFNTVKDALISYKDDKNDIGELLKSAGQALLFSAGGAMGPLYGSAFLEAGKSVAGKSVLSYEEFIDMWSAFVNSIGKRGEKIGEKTMFDTIKPAVTELENAYRAGITLKEACISVNIAAKNGMEATKDMIALRGRSSRLGERSLGHIDPGAASMYTFISTFFGSIAETATAD